MPQTEATRVLAIRHGETDWNVGTRIQGQLDVALNDKGRWQAVRVAQAVAEEGIDVIYASDLVRAFDTAQAIGAAIGIEVRPDVGLRERGFGRFEGETWAAIEANFPSDSARWRARDLEFAPERGETLRVFYARVVATAERLAGAHPGRTVALVAHGGVMDCLYRAAARVDLAAPRTWQLGNAAVNRLLYTPEGFTIVGWSDTSHLDGRVHDEFSDGGVGGAPSLIPSADKVGHAA